MILWQVRVPCQDDRSFTRGTKLICGGAAVLGEPVGDEHAAGIGVAAAARRRLEAARKPPAPRRPQCARLLQVHWRRCCRNVSTGGRMRGQRDWGGEHPGAGEVVRRGDAAVAAAVGGTPKGTGGFESGGGGGGGAVGRQRHGPRQQFQGGAAAALGALQSLWLFCPLRRQRLHGSASQHKASENRIGDHRRMNERQVRGRWCL